MSYRTFKNVPKLSIKGDALHQLAQVSQGNDEFATLRLSGNVADAESFTIGGTKYWLKQMNTASGTLGSAALNNTTAGDYIRGVVITAHGFSVGHVFRVNNEYFKVVEVQDVNTVAVARGYAGSTVAAQASGQNVLKAANYTNVNLVSDRIIPVGATLTPAAAGALIVSALNAWKDYGITAEYLGTPTHVLLKREAQGNTLTVTEAMANATCDATFRAGVEKAECVMSSVSRAPSAQEVTDGYMHFVFPFPVKDVKVQVRVTATRATKAWDGVVTYSADFKRVTLDNAGATDWAATDTVTVLALG